MEEPQRTIALNAYKALCGQFDELVARTVANLEAGAQPEDILAAEGTAMAVTEHLTAEQLAFAVAGIALREAQMSVKKRGSRKQAVPAQRVPRKRAAGKAVIDGEVSGGLADGAVS